MEWSIIREPDDGIAKTRISLGQPKDFNGAYMVFRGDPRDIIELLEKSLSEARRTLLRGMYEDKRGRPQG
jgi:hypothetical protein